jgi:Rhs element Vgr protein
MAASLTEQVTAALAQFSSNSRLYELTIGDGSTDLGSGGLLVEAFAADDGVQEIGARDVIVLSTSAYVELEALLCQQAALEVSLAYGTRTRFAGEISEVDMLGSDGGLTRYRVRISPWMWRLGHVRNSRVWQDKTVIEIVDSVFESYLPLAKWRWSSEAGPFMDGAMPRSYCCQYRESDLDFVRRILTEEGLAWRFEQTDDGPGAVLFADSSALSAVPEDASSAADDGIRFHGVRSVERRDTVQALIAQRRLHATLATVLSYDYKSRQVVAGSSPTRFQNGRNVPALESYDVPGQYAYANREQAQRYADLQMQGKEARSQLWRGRSTVRTLRAGTRMTVTGTPLQQLGDASAFTVLRVTSVGVNNMPPPAQHALAELFGPIPELLEEVVRGNEPDDLSLVIAQASETGYANSFEAVPVDLPWRPQLSGSDGRSHAKPTVFGSQTAIVIGPDGGDCPNGADELYCDRLGRVRIRYHWQDSGDSTCWVRVAQRSAGGGVGSQFLPRIGQEVLVQFLENDIDRPVIVGALYNGQGEGGVAPTPGGRDGSESQASCFNPAHDHAPSAQGNLAGGHSPVWHGASGDSAGHRNGAAQWGVRSKEFGGSGYNQLLFDDTDGQGRVQLKSTHAASELNLGHLIHAADNYRGSFRGLGAELRTDAYGAVRAGAGLLMSSYKINHSALARDPAGENAPGIAMLQQAVKLAETFSSAAVAHQTVGLAAHTGAAKANASLLDEKASPLKAMLTALSGMVGNDSLDAAKADASSKNTNGGGGKLPHSTDAVIAISAKDGLGANTGQSLQLANGETVTLMSGQDTQFVTGGQMRVHTGQAIGVLGGAVKSGEGETGLQLIAAKDAIDIQAQANELKVQARDQVDLISVNAHIDWAAAKSISLSTAGGANITISGGNITVQCPGKITVKAGKKSFTGPEKMAFSMPSLPYSICVACLKKSLDAGPAFTMVE